MNERKRLLLRAAYVTIFLNKHYDDSLFFHGWRITLTETFPFKRWPLTEEDVKKVDGEYRLLGNRNVTDIINTWFGSKAFLKSINNAETITERIAILIDNISELTNTTKEEVFDWLIYHEIKKRILIQVQHRKLNE